MDEKQWGTRRPVDRTRAGLAPPSTKLVQRRLEAVADRIGRDVLTLPLDRLREIAEQTKQRARANSGVDEDAYTFALDRHNDYALVIELRERLEALS